MFISRRFEMKVLSKNEAAGFENNIMGERKHKALSLRNGSHENASTFKNKNLL